MCRTYCIILSNSKVVISSNVVEKRSSQMKEKKEKKKNEFPSKYDFIGFDCTRVLRVKVGLPATLRRQRAFY